MVQEEKTTLSGFIEANSISDGKWGALIDLLGLYSDKLKAGEPFSGRDIQHGLNEILDVHPDNGTSLDVLKAFLQAAYNENVYPEVTEYIKEHDLPNLI